MKKRKSCFGMIMTFIMMLSIFPIVPMTAHAADGCDASARAEFGGLDNKNLFLGGKYIELGISQWGDFGTEGIMHYPVPGDRPANFHGTDQRQNIAMSADHDGFCQGVDLPVDYFLPGSPEERFAVGYTSHPDDTRGGISQSNSALMDGESNGMGTIKSKLMPTTVTNTSDLDNGILSATIVSYWRNGSLSPKMEVTQVISFHEDDKFFRNEVTLKNITDEGDYPQSWTGARYTRSLDPDNTVDQNDGRFYETRNVVTHTVAEDGMAVVKAESHLDDDKLYQAFNSRMPIFYYSSDPMARGSVFGRGVVEPYTDQVYNRPRPKGDAWVNDVSIGMTWDAGPLEPGETSDVFTYYTSLDERVFEEVMADIKLDESRSLPLIEAETNDGTVPGNQKVVVSGATLVEPLDMDHIRVNNLPAGLGFETTRLSDTELDIQLTGKAMQHSSEFSVDHLSITIGKENVMGSSSDLTTKSFSIMFRDPPELSVYPGVINARFYNSLGYAFPQSENIELSIQDGKFAEDIQAADIQVNHLPAGLQHAMRVERLSDKKLKITFDNGFTSVAEDVNNVSITVAADKLIGSPDELTSNTFKMNFEEKEPFLTVATPLLYESKANDGSIDDKLVLEFLNGTLPESVTESVYAEAVNWPSGLYIGEVTRDNDTQLTLSIAGQADNHSVTDSVYDAQVNMMNMMSNTFSIIFRSPPPYITASPDIIGYAEDGTGIDVLTVALNNGIFAQDMSSGVTLNNLPEGLSFAVDRISDTELEIHFTGGNIQKNTATPFASVTVEAAKVIGAEAPLTSNFVELQVPQDDAQANLDAVDLTWDTIREENILQSSVTTDVDLLTEGKYGSTITWTSSDESVIALDGQVTRPGTDESDQAVKLIAEITYGTVSLTKPFDLIVKKLEESLPAQPLTFDNVTNGAVTKTYGDSRFTFTATSTKADGGPISYSSSDEKVATVDAATGKVAMHKAGEATITATAAKVPGLYGKSTATYVLTVNPKALTWNPDGIVKDKLYDGTAAAVLEQAPTLSGVVNGDAVTVTAGNVQFADVTAGTGKTIIADGWGMEGADANNYTVPTVQPTFQSADITKLQLTATATATDRAYDGTTAVEVTLTPTNTVGLDQVSLTATGTMADANAGTNKPVTISDIQLSGSDATNYMAPANLNTTVNITKASTGLAATSPILIYIHSSDTDDNTLELSTTLNPTGAADPGAITYTLDTLTNSDSVLAGSPVLNGTTLTYTGNGQLTGTATQHIRIASDNYADIIATIIFEATDKTEATVTVTPPANITYGQRLGDPIAGVSESVTDEDYTLSYSGTLTSGTPYGPSETKPTNAGSYTVMATLNSAVYYGSDSASFTIAKAMPTGEPAYTEISEAGETLAITNLTGEFTNPHNSDAVEGHLTWDDGDSATVTQGTSYDWTFTPNATNNYYVVTGSIIPWPAPPGGDIAGTLDITGTPSYGYVLTGNVNLTGDPWGNLTYTWKRGTTVLQTSTKTGDTDTYTIQAGDIGSTITLEVTSDYYAGTLTASTDVVTRRTVQEPSPPIVESATKFSITLRAAGGYEYTIDNGNTWQDSPVFTGLTPSTTYTFQQRIKATPTSFASDMSGTAEGTTLDKEQLQQPDNLRWDTTGTEVLAKWDDVPNHSGYIVQLYKDGVPVGDPIDINQTSYDFSAAIAAGGDGIYTFTVLAKGDNVSYIDSRKSRVTTAYVAKETRNVTGKVEDEHHNPVHDAEVRVMQGNTQIGITVMTALDGTFTITGIPAGSYNLVITKGDQRVTRYFTVGDTDYIFQEVITLPSGKKNSVLQVAQDTPDVVVDKLDDMFNQPEIYTPEDDATVAGGGKVEIKLSVEKNDNAAHVTEMSNAASSGGYTMGTALDLNVTKTATDNVGAVTAFTPISDTQVLLTIVIPIPEHEQGKSAYRLIRAHDYEDGNGVVTEYISPTANANGERIEVNADKTIITAYVRYFSTYAIAYPDGSQSGGGSGSSSSDQIGGRTTNTIVIVDGKNHFIGREEVEGSTTKSTPDQEKLAAEIAQAADSVVVPISENEEVSTHLVVSHVEAMKAKGMTLTVQTGNIAYNIDTTAINIDEIRTILGKDADTRAMPFVITIADAGDQVTVPDTAEEHVIIEPISFTISAQYDGKTVDVKRFRSYVNRTIEITQEQADRITTAVVIEPNGTLRHVPTEVYTQDGKHYAKINSLTNSLYTLIYNEQQFDDVIGTWYQEQADEMTSRKIVFGVSDGVFDGDRNITRAEFAAMIVRALGLPAHGQAAFSDVPAEAWYSGAVATAAEYGIVVGVGHNKFAPHTNISRQEAMAVLYNAAKLTPYVDQGIDNALIRTFRDYGTQSDWASAAVDYNLSNNFIVGYDEAIRPQEYITRSEAASVILRLLQKAQLVDVRSHP